MQPRTMMLWRDSFMSDVRYALRGFRATPGFVVVAALSLGLGIGANTAIFTLLDAVTLKALPVRHPEDLVIVTRNDDNTFTNPLWEQIRNRQNVFSGVAAYSSTNFNLATGGDARLVSANWVSGDFFPMLGVQPALGRLLARTDDWRGCPALAVISESLWATEFGARPNVVGETMSLEGTRFTIVGVAASPFFGVDVGRPTKVYVPLCAEAAMRRRNSQLDGRSSWWLHVIARRKAGLGLDQVKAGLAILAPSIARATLQASWPADATADYLRASLGVQPASGGLSGLRTQYRRPLWALMAVVSLVLLIACGNVANLLLARASTREREIAVRLALGAGRARLLRQLLTESLCLSLLGMAVGVVFAAWGRRVVVEMLSTSRDVVSLDVNLDLRVLSFTITVAVVTGIFFGLAPVWRAREIEPQAAMKAQSQVIGGTRSQFASGRALVVGQVALSLVLVVGGGLLLGSWRRQAAVDPGFRPEGVLLANVGTRLTSIPDSSRAGVYRQIVERLRSTPGVWSASVSDLSPITPGVWNGIIQVQGYSPKSTDDALVWINEVSDGYFATLGTPILVGRDFDRRDTPASTKVALVSETLARKFFGGGAVVGRQFRVKEGDRLGPPFEIVGVVKDMKYNTLRETSEPLAFFAQGQDMIASKSVDLEIRTRGDPAAAVPTVRSILSAIDPRLILEFRTLEDQVGESLRQPRALAMLASFFGALSLLLATIGLYGTISYSVARRRGEIGVRIALGATRLRVVRMVLSEVGCTVGVGLSIGAPIALVGSKFVGAFLYGVTPSDPATLLLSASALVAAGAGAALLPAAQAARVDPVESLRAA